MNYRGILLNLSLKSLKRNRDALDRDKRYVEQGE